MNNDIEVDVITIVVVVYNNNVALWACAVLTDVYKVGFIIFCILALNNYSIVGLYAVIGSWRNMENIQ